MRKGGDHFQEENQRLDERTLALRAQNRLLSQKFQLIDNSDNYQETDSVKQEIELFQGSEPAPKGKKGYPIDLLKNVMLGFFGKKDIESIENEAEINESNSLIAKYQSKVIAKQAMLVQAIKDMQELRENKTRGKKTTTTSNILPNAERNAPEQKEHKKHDAKSEPLLAAEANIAAKMFESAAKSIKNTSPEALLARAEAAAVRQAIAPMATAGLGSVTAAALAAAAMQAHHDLSGNAQQNQANMSKLAGAGAAVGAANSANLQHTTLEQAAKLATKSAEMISHPEFKADVGRDVVKPQVPERPLVSEKSIISEKPVIADRVEAQVAQKINQIQPEKSALDSAKPNPAADAKLAEQGKVGDNKVNNKLEQVVSSGREVADTPPPSASRNSSVGLDLKADRLANSGREVEAPPPPAQSSNNSLSQPSPKIEQLASVGREADAPPPPAAPQKSAAVQDGANNSLNGALAAAASLKNSGVSMGNGAGMPSVSSGQGMGAGRSLA